MTRAGAAFLNGYMDCEPLGGWVYIMANRYRGALYVGVTSALATRVSLGLYTLLTLSTIPSV